MAADIAKLAAQLADARRREEEARRAELEAKVRARGAVREQAAILQQLHAQGIDFTDAAIARALGVVPTRAARQRLGADLRRKLWRASHRDANPSQALLPPTPTCSGGAGPITPAGLEAGAGGKLLKRTVEIFEGAEDVALDEEDAAAIDDVAEPRPRRARK